MTTTRSERGLLGSAVLGLACLMACSSPSTSERGSNVGSGSGGSGDGPDAGSGNMFGAGGSGAGFGENPGSGGGGGSVLLNDAACAETVLEPEAVTTELTI